MKRDAKGRDERPRSTGRLRMSGVLLGITAMMIGCTGGEDFPAEWRQPMPVGEAAAQAPEPLEVRFLGAGGIYLRHQDEALLGDPFFSNPPLRDWLFLRPLHSRTDVVDAQLPDLTGVRGVLIGHGHFDHLLDVPHILSRLPASVRAFGSATALHQIAAAVEEARRYPLDASMAGPDGAGQWIVVSPRLRILPIRSEHSPHLAGHVFAGGQVETPRAALPGSVLDWQAGTNLTYVIEVLALSPAAAGPAEVLYRVFYQSSASSAPVGFPPEAVLRAPHGFDLAILCAANFNQVSGYPERLLERLAPREVMLIHWEVFWDDYRPGQERPLPGLDFTDLNQRIGQALGASATVWMPRRGESIRIAPRAGEPAAAGS